MPSLRRKRHSLELDPVFVAGGDRLHLLLHLPVEGLQLLARVDDVLLGPSRFDAYFLRTFSTSASRASRSASWIRPRKSRSSSPGFDVSFVPL